MIKFLFMIFLVFSFNALSQDFIAQDKARWETLFVNVAPKLPVSAWYLPFATINRSDIKTLSVVSTFGSARSSFRSGHFHTGLDCIPKGTKEPVYVYAMGEGVVCSVHLGNPFKTVVVRHLAQDGSTIYTSYKHIEDILVKNGDIVNKDTRIARVLNKAESKKYHGAYNHLHLEIRKTFDDYGCASWLTMNKADLEKRFMDPLEFMKKNVGKK
jgi:murein DD-endopeptidase MepM/ murein hydrolase activator NlpD